MTTAPTASLPRRVHVAADADVAVACADRRTGNLAWHLGDGDVAAARRALCAAVGGELGSSVWMEQTHGAGVAVVGRADAGRGALDRADAVPGVDAMVTTDTDLTLVVGVADCVPLVLVAPGAGVGVVHAGRPGVQADVTTAAVDALAEATGTAPTTFAAVVGPAVGSCCYEVPQDMATAVSALVPETAARTSWGSPSLDLVAGVQAQLHRAGVTAVTLATVCTRCNADVHFSHRAHTADPAVAEGRQGMAVRRAAPHGPEGEPSLHSR